MSNKHADLPTPNLSDARNDFSATDGKYSHLPNIDRIALFSEANSLCHKWASPADHAQHKHTKVYELAKLKHNAGNASGPDAIVRLPADFDPCKPINVVIYNHGFEDSAKSSVKNADLNEQMAEAPPNTVLIVPEWQKQPGSRSGDQGNFQKPGEFKHMLEDAFAATPELRGKHLQNVEHIGIVAHSAGYGPATTELYKNDLGDKVNSVTLLDSLYNPKAFDPWLEANIQDLSEGKKHFTNIFGDSTEGPSKAQAIRVEKMLEHAGLSKSSMVKDYNHGKQIMDPATLAGHPIIFKYSNATVAGKGSHASLPNLYVHNVEVASL